MKNNYILYLVFAVFAFTFTSCYDRAISTMEPQLATVSNFQATLTGDSVKLTWTLPTGKDSLSTSILYNDGVIDLKYNKTSYTFGVVQTNKPYSFTVKIADRKGNTSLGQTIKVSRPGADPVTNVVAMQNGPDAVISWTLPSTSVTGIVLKYSGQTINLPATATSYTIPNAAIGSYVFSLVTSNNQSQVSSTVYASLKVGATAVAFIGLEADSLTFLSNGDDDQVASAKWLFKNYSTSRYITFDMIKSGKVDLSQFRVLWWNYDVTTGNALPAVSIDPTVVSKITSYYKNGGNVLFSTYALQYFWTMGRMTKAYKLAFDNGVGGYNPDVWGIGVNIHSKHDQSTHPLYKGIDLTTQTDGRKTFPVIGAGWKENHNGVMVEMPAFYGLPNDSEDAYTKFTQDNNLLWLGMWDGIGDYYMVGIFELQPMGDFQGTGISIGIGGIEWHQNDVVNPYQANIEKLYKNAIDYLKTK